MEGTRPTTQGASSLRHFREQSDARGDDSVEIGIRTEAPLEVESPLEVNMTDEPGGDPYNHTGSFRRMYR